MFTPYASSYATPSKSYRKTRSGSRPSRLHAESGLDSLTLMSAPDSAPAQTAMSSSRPES